MRLRCHLTKWIICADVELQLLQVSTPITIGERCNHHGSSTRYNPKSISYLHTARISFQVCLTHLSTEFLVVLFKFSRSLCKENNA
mmetsp:Transcript_7580/g.11090  ORF Transcript_7580/g.11090 Transcript_7580/m.11090 type:complete len:86 (+) Transcript_7580:1055-1312(+)